MPLYYVNTKAQDNGDHEVHKEGCQYLAACQHCVTLGHFNNCREAVAAAKKAYPKADGCFYCCYEAHTS